MGTGFVSWDSRSDCLASVAVLGGLDELPDIQPD